jgi:hypothetical protein
MITFVSAFLDLSEDRTALRSSETYMQHFVKMAETGINIHLFLNEVCRPFAINLNFERFPNVHVEYIEFEQLRSFPAAQRAKLPAFRHETKDTRNYLILMNAKVDFVYRAIQRDVWGASHFYWIDFGVFHVIKDITGSQDYLRAASTATLPMSLLMPGCLNMGNFDYFDNICWRFCGGVFAGDKDSLVQFYITLFEVYDKVTRERGLTWEVNMWAYLESLGLIHPTWIYAGHDDSILRIAHV